jgi:hypothetical protein
MKDVLEVQRPSLQSLQASGSSDDLRAEFKATLFDSQLYLFEAVGYLISLDSTDMARQEELLKVCICIYFVFQSNLDVEYSFPFDDQH